MNKTVYLKGGREVEAHNQGSKCRGNGITVGGDDDDSPGVLYCCGKHKVYVIRQFNSNQYKSSTYKTEGLKHYDTKTGYFDIGDGGEGIVKA